MIWATSRATRQSPSELLNIEQWASEMLGMPDMWTPMQFDAALSYFGGSIESKLQEFDPKTHKPRYRLKDLLSDDGGQRSAWNAFLAMAGVQVRKG